MTRYAILGDIHANLEAFTAVLEDIQRRGGMDKLWCLGDIVGYGPDPRGCIELLRQQHNICVAGNHDLAATGKIDTAEFNPEAAAAVRWTSQQLSSSDIEYLNSLPMVIEEGDFTLAHGSPRDPLWEYVKSADIAAKNLAHFKTPYCLVGHSHVPLVFRFGQTGAGAPEQPADNIGLVLGHDRLMINPGGVGQPRDGDSRASYAIYDSETRVIQFHRVPYHIAATQAKMLKLNLPVSLITRLSYGL